MRIGVCIGIDKLPAELPQELDFVETKVDDLLCPRHNEAVFQQRLAAARDCGMSVEVVNQLFPGDFKTTGPAVNVAVLDAYMKIVIQRAAAAQVRVIVGSGGSRRVPDGFEHRRAENQLVNHLRRWAPLAAPSGLVIALEPINKGECNIINTVEEAATLVRMEQSTSVRLLADTYHMLKDGEKPDIIRRTRGLIAHVHVAQAEGRGPLHAGGEDHRPYFKALKDGGYDGRVSIEARWDNFALQLPAAVVELKKQWETA